MSGTPEFDPDSPTPLYHQIFLHFRHRILAGELGNGTRLPAEAEIAQSFGVSRITARRAMNDLAGDGLVRRHRGQGTIVTHVMPERPRGDGLTGLLENLAGLAASTQVSVLTFDYVGAPDPVAALLEVPPGARVQRAERRRARDGRPFSYILSHLPERVGRAFDREQMESAPIMRLIEEAGHRVGSARQTITAAAADPVVAQTLNLPPGAPVLKITRVVRDVAGRPILCLEVQYRPDMYQIEMELDRTGGETGQRVWSSES